MINFLDILDSKGFKTFIKNDVLQYETINGVKAVSNQFIQKMIDVDPIALMEDFYKSRYPRSMDKAFQESTVGSSIVATQIHRVIKEEVAKLTQDISFGGKFVDYKKCFEMLGFVEVSRKSYKRPRNGNFESKESMTKYAEKNNYNIIENSIKSGKCGSANTGVNADYISNESEVFFWHYDHSMIIHMDSYGDSANSITLYCNGELRVGYERFNGMNLVPCTDTWEMMRDLRELPVFQIQEILKKFKPHRYMSQFSDNLYSYLTHKDFKISDNELWEQSRAEKLNRLPNDIKSFILEKNSHIDKKLADFHKSSYPNSMYLRVSSVSEKLSDETKLSLAISDYFLDFRFSDNWFKIFNDQVLELFYEHGLSALDIKSYGAIIYKKIDISVFDISFEKKELYLMSLSHNELSFIIENCSNFKMSCDEDYAQLIDIAKSLNGQIVLNS